MRKHYVGMDVHQASTSIAVMNSQGKLISESLIETKAQTVVDYFKGLSGEVHVTFEEGTQAAWLYDLISHTRPLSPFAIPITIIYSNQGTRAIG